MRLHTSLILIVCGTSALSACNKPVEPLWAGPNAIVSGAVQQSAIAALGRGTAVSLWSTLLPEEEADSDQTNLDTYTQTRYRVFARLAIYASDFRTLGTGDQGWATPQPLQTSARIAVRREDRDNATGAVTRVYATQDATLVAQPRLATDASGHAFAVWQQKDLYVNAQGITRLVSHVYFALFSSDTLQWSSPTILDQNNTSQGVGSLHANEPLDAYDPDLSVNPSGDALVVWRQLSDVSGPSQIMARRYRPDVGWPLAAQKISTAGVGHDADMPRVRLANDNSGIGYAIWRQHQATVHNADTYNRFVVYAAKYTGTAWTNITQLSDGLVDAVEPTLAVNTNNRAAVAWAQLDYTFNVSDIQVAPSATTKPPYVYSVYANRYNGTAWLANAEEIDGANVTARSVDIALDGNDNLYAVWLREITPASDQWNNDRVIQVYRREFIGNTWTTPNTLDGETRFDTDTPHIIAHGNTLLTYWKRWRDPLFGNGFEMLAQRYRNGAWGDIHALGMSDEDAFGATAAISADGTAYVAWISVDRPGNSALLVSAATP
ncbi:MAG: hypothetical protein OEW08_07440 [Gammaproteobacteria bacterium]|nr:hypothetical protein [Gammaproteobacteria bacterium]